MGIHRASSSVEWHIIEADEGDSAGLWLGGSGGGQWWFRPRRLVQAFDRRNRMTLVVSDISKHGIVMVGDSAVTKRQNGLTTVSADAVKIHYSARANVGFAIWGRAAMRATRFDYWLRNFIETEIAEGDSVEAIGTKLAEQINADLAKMNKPWTSLVRGVHVAGYRDGNPVLFHVHCGHANEPSHELRLYRDYPDDQKISPEQFSAALNSGYVHLRNGYHPHFGALFNSLLGYTAELRRAANVLFPYPSTEGRLEFYKLLVKFVAETLVASKQHPGVNDILGAIAFDETGMKIDKRLPFPAESFEAELDEEFEFEYVELVASLDRQALRPSGK